MKMSLIEHENKLDGSRVRNWLYENGREAVIIVCMGDSANEPVSTLPYFPFLAETFPDVALWFMSYSELMSFNADLY